MEGLEALTGGQAQDSGFVEYLVTIKSSTDMRDTLLQNLGPSDRSAAFADEFIRRVEFERSSEPADSSSSGAGGAGGRKKGRRRQGSKVDPSLVLGLY
jgi:hypothetical protein